MSRCRKWPSTSCRTLPTARSAEVDPLLSLRRSKAAVESTSEADRRVRPLALHGFDRLQELIGHRLPLRPDTTCSMESGSAMSLACLPATCRGLPPIRRARWRTQPPGEKFPIRGARWPRGTLDDIAARTLRRECRRPTLPANFGAVDSAAIVGELRPPYHVDEEGNLSLALNNRCHALTSSRPSTNRAALRVACSS